MPHLPDDEDDHEDEAPRAEPEPQPDEDTDDFIDRCIPFLIEEDGVEPDVATSRCFQIARDAGRDVEEPPEGEKALRTRERISAGCQIRKARASWTGENAPIRSVREAKTLKEDHEHLKK